MTDRSLVVEAGALEEIAGLLTRHSISSEVWQLDSSGFCSLNSIYT